MTIADRAVLVTGANRGIGQALVEEALRRGAKRVYAGTRQPLAHLDGRVTPLSLDVTNAAQIQGAVYRYHQALRGLVYLPVAIEIVSNRIPLPSLGPECSVPRARTDLAQCPPS
jgi:NAD(P)-dependent dehydrogenase (short-subunit alcohol dehydrogenase family)